MLKTEKGKLLHDFFEIGMIIKLIEGILQFLAGILVLVFKSDFVISLVQIIFKHEILEDSGDFLANMFINLSQSLSISSIFFLGFYLILNGLVKLVLFFGLWYEKICFYILAEFILFLFVVFQIIKFFSSNHLAFLLLALLDIGFIFLINIEYRKLIVSKDKE